MSIGLHEFNVHFSITIVITVITGILPVWRVYILRKRKRNRIALFSDIFYGFAWMLNLAMHVHEVQGGSRERLLRLKSESEIEVILGLVDAGFLKFELAELVAQANELWAIKAAFVCFYWNISIQGNRPVKKIRIALYITVCFLAASYVVIMVEFFTYCRPLSRNWDLTALIVGTWCSPIVGITPQSLWIALTLSTDLTVLGIPFLILRTISNGLSNLEKRFLPGLFLIGVLGTTAPTVRYIVNIKNGLYQIGNKQAKPVTLQQYHLGLTLANLEVVCAFVAFALPAFRFLLTGAFWRKKREQVTPVMSRSSGKRKRTGPSDTELLRSDGTTLVGLESSLMGKDDHELGQEGVPNDNSYELTDMVPTTPTRAAIEERVRMFSPGLGSARN